MIRQRFQAGSAARMLTWMPFLIVAGLICPGCGGEDWHAATYPASGSLTINGQPAEGAVVELESVGQPPDSRNSRPWAIVQDDGSFTLSTYESGDGAPPGEYAVTVRWPPDVTQPSLADRLGGAFATAENSKWNVTITEGENELSPIAIDDVQLQADSSANDSRKAPPGPPLGK